MPKEIIPARRRRLFEEILDAAHILTDLRRDLHVFCELMVRLHTVSERVPADPKKSYLKGMRRVIESLKEILTKRRKPSWQERWGDERRQRLAEISRIQRRQEHLRVGLLPEPEEPGDIDRILRISNDATELEKRDKKRVALLRKLKKCDLNTEGGIFEAEAVVADIQENDEGMKALQIDIAIDWVMSLRKQAERNPKGDVKPLPRSEYLMLALNQANSKVAVYRVSSTTEEIGRDQLEKETRTTVIAVYNAWREAARYGLNWESAPRFSVTEYTSGEIECSFNVDLS